MTEHYLTQTIDETSRDALAARGLRMSLVDLADAAVGDDWLRADFRGFLGSSPSPERLAEARGYQTDRRTTGVYDDDLAIPVGTSQSWITPLTLPGLTTLPSWAISSVTVAPTHRRRGIATSMLQAELRTAHALEVPVAILTVSESTIYHRFGFGPATVLAGYEIDTKRAGWRGRDVGGRLAFVDPIAFRATGAEVLDRVRRSRAGEIAKSPFLADRLTGPLGTNEKKDGYRVVRYDDADGVCQGFVVFTLEEHDTDFAMHTLTVQHLASTTDDAYLALWRFVLEHDLVGTVKTYTTGDAEALPLLVSDFRRARQAWREDHLWVRILDVPRALEARRYEHDGSIVLHVDDMLGFAAGTWRLTVEGGIGTVDVASGDADVTLPAAALGSLYLGGIRAHDLALRGELMGDVAAMDRLFRTIDPPVLGSWF